MASSQNFVLTNLLCFTTIKCHLLPAKQLKSVVLDFYTSEDISVAKELLFLQLESLKIDKEIKILRRRRDSIRKPGVKASSDIDDILFILIFLDKKKLLDDIAVFVSSSPGFMPSSRLPEGDLSIILTKLINLEELCHSLKMEINATRSLCNVGQTAIASNRCVETLTGIDTGKNSSLTVAPECSYSLTEYNRNIIQPSQRQNFDAESWEFPTNRGAIGRSTWASQMAEAENESDDPFVKFKTRQDKRKGISPTIINQNNSDGELARQNKRQATETNAISYARVAATNPPTATRINNSASVRVVGKAVCSTLKAAPRDTSPLAIFCVSNVSWEHTVNDIRKHCAGLGIKVRFVYDITSRNQVARAFKLAIGSNDTMIVQDCKSWPEGVSVRSWRHYNRPGVAGSSPGRETSARAIERTPSRPTDRDVAAATGYNRLVLSSHDDVQAVVNCALANNSVDQGSIYSACVNDTVCLPKNDESSHEIEMTCGGTEADGVFGNV